VVDENGIVGDGPVCCKDVVYGIGRGNEGEVCRRVDIVGLIASGPTAQQYEAEKKRFTKVKPLIDTYQGCNSAQKRLILYGVLHKMLYSTRDKAKGQRDPMPECIKYAVRRQCTEAVTAVQVKVKSERLSVASVGVKGV
jgi:hypothetical protein